MSVVVIGCGKAKADTARPARELYTGNLFRAQLAHALTLDGAVYIVSALHGLLELDQVVEPYEFTLAAASKREREAWGARTFSSLRSRHRPTRLVLLAGDTYAQPLFANATWAGWTPVRPLHGMQLGERLATLKMWRAVAGQAAA